LPSPHFFNARGKHLIATNNSGGAMRRRCVKS
jgi:hypothetical protein